MENADIKAVVREKYGEIAKTESSCCNSSCGCHGGRAKSIAKKLGYEDRDLEEVPEGSNLGLGCGNPIAISDIREGDLVVDLGSGAGFDSFIAAKKTGSKGRVIGIDMTPEMLEKAKKNAVLLGFKNVEFIQGEIENIPLPSGIADIVISNCVINLSPDKGEVFREIFRILKPGGKMFISDIVLLRELPPSIKESVNNYIGCISGASMMEDYFRMIENAGFENIRKRKEVSMPEESVESAGVSGEVAREAAESVASITVSARKSE